MVNNSINNNALGERERINVDKIANLLFLDNLDFDAWDSLANTPRNKNIIHGLRNALIYATRRKQLRGLMKKLYEEFLNIIEAQDPDEAQFLEKELKRFLERHGVEVL